MIDPDGPPASFAERGDVRADFPIDAAPDFTSSSSPTAATDVIGVNPDRRESNLEVIPDEVLSLWRGNRRSGRSRQAAAGGAAQEQTQAPYSLWWYIMLLVLAAAIAESLLADRYLGTQQQEDL